MITQEERARYTRHGDVAEQVLRFFGLVDRLDPDCQFLEVMVFSLIAEKDEAWWRYLISGRFCRETEYAPPSKIVQDYGRARIDCFAIPRAEWPRWQETLAAPEIVMDEVDTPALEKLSDSASVASQSFLYRRPPVFTLRRAFDSQGVLTPLAGNELFHGKGLPPALNVNDLADHWTQLRGSGLVPWTALILQVEDHRGQIQRVELADWLRGALRVHVRSERDLVRRVSYVLDNHKRGDLKRVDDKVWEATLPDMWDRITVLLFSEDELLEKKGPLPRSLLTASLPLPVPPAEFDALLARETDRVEFKSWRSTEASRGGSKSLKETLLKEIVGFANHHGGDLLLGADDNGVVDGPEGKVHGDRIDLTAETRQLVEKIQRYVTEEIKPSLSAGVLATVHRGRELILVRVPKGEQKPYTYGNGVFYVRDGATSRPATRADVLTMLGK